MTLPEISKVLSAHPGVRRAETAFVRHDGRDVAIAAAELSGYVSGPILRNHVRRELGEHSGLAGVLIVEHMPMTDGAVDAGYLASAVAEGRCILFEDPRDDVERRLAAIWSAKMNVRPVGVNDDYAFAMWLIKECGVATVPGSSFYAHTELGRTKIRFCFPKTDDILREAGERLQKLRSLV